MSGKEERDRPSDDMLDLIAARDLTLPEVLNSVAPLIAAELVEARRQIAELQTEINELAAQLEADDRENARLTERAERAEAELIEARKQIAELESRLVDELIAKRKATERA